MAFHLIQGEKGVYFLQDTDADARTRATFYNPKGRWWEGTDIGGRRRRIYVPLRIGDKNAQATHVAWAMTRPRH
ncbi:hypothetical protein ACFQ07_14885 [Actinomadura adrarensis]|uniref:Uncharacterized protein n=1 Tax=Actinomadura adrarensis TaxID=1819600 RepID=A0ABW3CG60_9ACTN